MAHTKSALKRVRQSKKRQARNLAVKSTVRTSTRACREALETGEKDKSVAALAAATKTLGKAASKGVIRKKTASRRASLRLDRTFQEAGRIPRPHPVTHHRPPDCAGPVKVGQTVGCST